MTEVTQETFKLAALEAGERLRGGGDIDKKKDKKDKDSIRSRIKEILAEDENQDDVVREISSAAAERIVAMLWPEKGLEIKKKQAEMEVERGALIGYIRELLREDA